MVFAVKPPFADAYRGRDRRVPRRLRHHPPARNPPQDVVPLPPGDPDSRPLFVLRVDGNRGLGLHRDLDRRGLGWLSRDGERLPRLDDAANLQKPRREVESLLTEGDAAARNTRSNLRTVPIL